MIVHHHQGWISKLEVESRLGWVVKPEGLCKGEVCIPLDGHPELIRDDSLHLRTLARLLKRPLAMLDEPELGYLGPESDAFAAGLGELWAPDFSLPDLDGRVHSLSEHRGSKVLLAAWASW